MGRAEVMRSKLTKRARPDGALPHWKHLLDSPSRPSPASSLPPQFHRARVHACSPRPHSLRLCYTACAVPFSSDSHILLSATLALDSMSLPFPPLTS